jgi:hypothetical protein
MASGKYQPTSPLPEVKERPGKPKSTLATVINSLDKLVSEMVFFFAIICVFGFCHKVHMGIYLCNLFTFVIQFKKKKNH